MAETEYKGFIIEEKSSANIDKAKKFIDIIMTSVRYKVLIEGRENLQFKKKKGAIVLGSNLNLGLLESLETILNNFDNLVKAFKYSDVTYLDYNDITGVKTTSTHKILRIDHYECSMQVDLTEGTIRAANIFYD